MTTDHAQVPAPEDCPEPFWHDTHNYCSACSWTIGQCEAIWQETVHSEHRPCSLPVDHDGEHETTIRWKDRR